MPGVKLTAGNIAQVHAQRFPRWRSGNELSNLKLLSPKITEWFKHNTSTPTKHFKYLINYIIIFQNNFIN